MICMGCLSISGIYEIIFDVSQRLNARHYNVQFILGLANLCKVNVLVKGHTSGANECGLSSDCRSVIVDRDEA